MLLTPMPDGWRNIGRGLYESADGQWRIANPWRLTTELRHRWLVAERSSGSGWCMHDGDHATLHHACAYVARLTDAHLTARPAGSSAGEQILTQPASRLTSPPEE